METKFNFNSQICTSIEQSRRLLELGLKKETADMMYEGVAERELPRIMPHETEMDYFKLWDSIIPSWSLHRLMSMLTAKRKCLLIRVEADLYDVLIDRIEHEIKEEHFNKEYLEE